ncbi:MAG TPA: hypothetical protein VF430_06210 [Verrucomicrobiae bacterium]
MYFPIIQSFGILRRISGEMARQFILIIWQFMVRAIFSFDDILVGYLGSKALGLQPDCEKTVCIVTVTVSYDRRGG